MAKNVDLQLSELTKAQLDALVSGSQLSIGMRYKITDRGDRGITLTAISSNKLSLEGIRTMLCPKTYRLETLDTNIWKGVWHSTKTAAIDDLMIWGGLVWKNLTGAIGTATNDIALDVVNWIEIPKASFTNNEYIEIIFSIHYDYERDWIVKQWDKNSNEFGIPKEGYEEYISTLGKNPVDISDWNYTNDDTTNELLIRNKCVGIWNNVEGIKIHHNICTGAIYGNSFTVANKSISGNYIGSPYGSISNNRLPNSIDANYCEGISGNTNNGSINGNQIVGSINTNSNNGFIINNNCETISGNTSGGRIAWNVCRGVIQNNTNTNSIETNACGNIIGNANSGQIINNTNGGGINNNTVNVTSIAGNHNLGSIDSNSNIGSISTNLNGGSINSNSGTGDITNAWSGKDISSRVLTTNIDYFPYKKYVALLTQSGTSVPVATVLEDTIGIVGGDYSRVDIGDYLITKVGTFTVGKTYFYSRQNSDVDQGLDGRGVYLNHNFATPSDTLRLSVGDGGSGQEDVLDSGFYGEIEIRIYQ